MTTILKQNLCPLKSIVMVGGFLGLLPSLLTWALMSSGGFFEPGLFIGWIVVLYVILPVILLIAFRCHLGTPLRRLLAFLFASIGSALPLYVFALVEEPEAILAGLIVNAALFGLWCILSLLGWSVITRVWPFRLQDGSTCPNCGYCVRGVASRVCPECGRGFTESDLGLSVEQFEQLICNNANALL